MRLPGLGEWHARKPIDGPFDVDRRIGTLKTGVVFHQQYATQAEARLDIFEYIEVFYNRFRCHSALDYKSPVNYEALPLGA